VVAALAAVGWPALGLLLAGLVAVLGALVGVVSSNRLTDNAVRLLCAVRGSSAGPGHICDLSPHELPAKCPVCHPA
jgi:hypothetical protein